TLFPYTTLCRSVPAPAFLEDLIKVGLRHLKRGDDAEDDAGHEADRHEEREHGCVHRKLDPIGLSDIGDRDIKQADADKGQHPAQHSAKKRKQGAFDKKLADETSTAGA